MSVLVKKLNEPYFKLFTKGSPEKIKELCNNDTIPKDFQIKIEKYAIVSYLNIIFSRKD